MRNPPVSSYRRAKRGFAVASMAALLLGIAAGGALADGYGEAKKVGGSDDNYTFGASTYAETYKNDVYQYATGEDGSAYYAIYDGQEWSAWQRWEDQPVKYKYDPAPVTFRDGTYICYTGEDGFIYWNWYDGEKWGGWAKIESEQRYASAPYGKAGGDLLDLYATGEDGYVYLNRYDGADWAGWINVSGESKATYEPYALAWGGYQNVFWTGEDGNVYWHRYKDQESTGAKALPYGDEEYEFADAPYALGYQPERKLFAYAITKDGEVAFNAFDGDAWSTWEVIAGEAELNSQPSVYEYDGAHHLICTGRNGHAYYIRYDDGEWSDWQDLGDNFAYDPQQYRYRNDPYLTYTGKDGHAYYREYAPGEEDDDGY